MTRELKERICALCEWEEANDKVFVFGFDVYQPQEAREAMLDNADAEIESESLSEDEWMERMEECIHSVQ